jgi:hypothetical protein
LNEQETAVKAKSRKPMVARFFDKDGEEIKQDSVQWALGENAFHFESVGDAKALGRRLYARGFRIWLGWHAEEDPDSPTTLFYIRIDDNSRYQTVNEDGFKTYFQNLIDASIRRQNIQLLRSNNDPAYAPADVREARLKAIEGEG